MNKLYNSIYEIKLRILLMLSETTIYPLSKNMILALDFISVYGKEFGLNESNLHGDSKYKYCELPSRKELVDQAITNLVLEGLLDVDTSEGYRYQINDFGNNYICSLDNPYADEYRKLIDKAIEKYGKHNDGELLKMIQDKSVVTSEED